MGARHNPVATSIVDLWVVPDYEEQLVALGLRSAVAKEVTRTWPAAAQLANASESELVAQGATKAQARRVVAAMALARLAVTGTQAPRVEEPKDVMAFLQHRLAYDDQENFVVIMLDTAQRVLDAYRAHRGSSSHVHVHPGDVFRRALRSGAHSIIVAHNHPSGSCRPSDSDLILTHRLAQVGATVGVPLVDHLIVCRGDFMSMAAEGIMDSHGSRS